MNGRIVQGTLLGIVLALVFNGLVYAFGQSRGVSYLVQQSAGAEPTTVSFGLVALVGTDMVVLGALLLWGLSRFVDNALTIFLWVAALVALISLIGPYRQALGVGSFASLGVMHVITAAAGMLGLAIFFHRCDDCIKN